LVLISCGRSLPQAGDEKIAAEGRTVSRDQY
jgi:hypothetical protein